MALKDSLAVRRLTLLVALAMPPLTSMEGMQLHALIAC